MVRKVHQVRWEIGCVTPPPSWLWCSQVGTTPDSYHTQVRLLVPNIITMLSGTGVSGLGSAQFSGLATHSRQLFVS